MDWKISGADLADGDHLVELDDLEELAMECVIRLAWHLEQLQQPGCVVRVGLRCAHDGDELHTGARAVWQEAQTWHKWTAYEPS